MDYEKCVCGNALSKKRMTEGIKVCPDCEPTDRSPGGSMICCNKLLEEYFEYCPYCGTKLNCGYG